MDHRYGLPADAGGGIGLWLTLGYDPTFSDFKSRGFQLEDSQLKHADRLERLILFMALAMHWCVRLGQDDALQRPTPLKKNERADRYQTLEF